MSDPGLPMALARSLSNRALKKGADRREWTFSPASEKLPLDEKGEVPLSRFARGVRDRHEWDYIIYITELPLWRDGRPIMFEISPKEKAALVSLPSLGVVNLKRRLGKLLDGVAKMMIEGEADGEFTAALRNPLQHPEEKESAYDYVLVGGRLGTLQLVLGMIRTNRPGRLITALSSSVATAMATGAFGVFYASIWDLADALHPLRLTAIAMMVIGAFTAWLIARNGLWNTPSRVTDAGRRRRDNAATLTTILISITIMFLLLVLALFVSGLIIIDSDFLASELDHDVNLLNYLRLAGLAACLGMMAGAVGSNFDSEETIREATYSRREVERRRLADEFADDEDDDRDDDGDE